MEKIVIAGGSGALGSAIAGRYAGTATEVVILSRTARPAQGNVRYVKWDARTTGSWVSELEDSSAIINLVGKSVNCRYTQRNKEEIVNSRVDATTVIGQAIKKLNSPPKVWINAGSAAIFGDSGDTLKREGDEVGEGFSPTVCKLWEQAFFNQESPGTRKAFLRIGLVLQANKGILKPFLNLAKLGFGGKIGTGSQYITWIHEEDFLNLIQWVIDTDQASGIIHACSPNPVTNKEFMQAISAAVKAPVALPNPAFLTRFGAIFIGTEAELVLSGRRVTSRILQENQFRFKYPHIKSAITQLIKTE